MLLCLDYCNAVFAGLPASTLVPLQRVLDVAACDICCDVYLLYLLTVDTDL